MKIRSDVFSSERDKASDMGNRRLVWCGSVTVSVSFRLVLVVKRVSISELRQGKEEIVYLLALFHPNLSNPSTSKRREIGTTAERASDIASQSSDVGSFAADDTDGQGWETLSLTVFGGRDAMGE